MVGNVSVDFSQYWKSKQEDLVSYLISDGEDGDEEGNSPPLSLDSQGDPVQMPWNEIDNLEHTYGPYADSSFHFVEIKLATGASFGELGPEWTDGRDHPHNEAMFEKVGEEKEGEYFQRVYSREAYSVTPTYLKRLNKQPEEAILTCLSQEKGDFGSLFVTTNGEDFEPCKLVIGVVETDLCELIESFWYDGQPLDIDSDECFASGKGFSAKTGFYQTDAHDKASDYGSESAIVKDFFAQEAAASSDGDDNRIS